MKRFVVAALVLVMLAPVAQARSPDKLLELVLAAYAKAWRWGGPDQLLDYLDPDYQAKHPNLRFELERLHQYEVGNYAPKSARRTAEDRYEQTVEIDLINIHTQAVKTIVDHQAWRYDAKTKHWWLTSGLPDPAPAQ